MFTVEILKTKNVSILKDLIKEKKAPHLNHIAASDLDLWQVNSLIDDLPSKDELTEKWVEDKPKMPSRRQLSVYFTGVLNEEYLHIIVRRPGMS
jgi:Crinkler effector protein N-terminal domain